MYLIDGNNLMGQRPGWHRDKEGARLRLLVELADLAAEKKLRLTVVFDGAPAAGFPDGSAFRGVTVHYARRGADADARIVEIAERHAHSGANRKALTVVTSDQTLAARVRVCGVRVMRAGEFRKNLLKAAPPAPETSKPVVPKDDMAGWLRYFGVDEEDD
ncbi:MAG: NYN domain-containing protein [Blastocatellia bacterium]